jgi:manganese/zinc/iron transport system permease protein
MVKKHKDKVMHDLWIIMTASLVAASTALVGSFLVLRRQSMIGDAISHSVLLGLVLAFLITDSRSMLVMLTGAVMIGLVTAWLSEMLNQLGKLQVDASIGIVFTLFFSIGVILVSLYADHLDFDRDHIIYGEITFIPFDTIIWGSMKDGIDLGPRAFWVIATVFMIVLLSITLGFERFKTVTFQPSLAISLGINVVFWNYFLMTLVSMTAVASFDAVGAILVVALLVIPASSAYLVAKSLKSMLIIAVGYSQVAVILGYSVAYWLDSSISASIAVSAGVLLFITIIVQQWKKKGQQEFDELQALPKAQ